MTFLKYILDAASGLNTGAVGAVPANYELFWGTNTSASASNSYRRVITHEENDNTVIVVRSFEHGGVCSTDDG
jgi:hypothetical protein